MCITTSPPRPKSPEAPKITKRLSMEYAARENSLPKRRKKVLSDGSEAERPPLYKKPKHRRSSYVSNTKSHSGALSDDDNIMQDKKYIDSKDLVSIRHAVEDLQFMGRNFHQEQQRRYEDMQSLGREFHRLQQKRYDGLMVWIDDTARRVDRQLRKTEHPKQEIKSEPNEEAEDSDVLSGLTDRTMGGILLGKRDIDIEDQDTEERTPPISSTQILPPPPLTTDSKDLANGKQSSRDSSLINEPERREQIPEPASSIKPPLHPRNTRTSRSPSGGFRVEKSPQDEALQSAGILNDNGAIEDMDIGIGSLDVEIKFGQHHSPSVKFPSSRDQTQPWTTSRNTTPTPDRTKNASSCLERSLRKRRSIDYYKVPSIDESEDPDTSLNETPSKASVKTPVRRRPRKMGGETHSPGSAKESTVKDGIGKKKSVKFSGGMKPGSMHRFIVRQTPNQGQTPIATSVPKLLREIDDQPHFLLKTDNGESEPAPAPANRILPSSSSEALQLGTSSRSQFVGAFPQVPEASLNKSTTNCSGPKSFGEKLSDAAAAGARYRAVRTSTTSLIH